MPCAFACSVYNTHYMSFLRKFKKGGLVYLAEVESRRVGDKVVQHFIRYVGKEADGRTILSASLSDDHLRDQAQHQDQSTEGFLIEFTFRWSMWSCKPAPTLACQN